MQKRNAFQEEGKRVVWSPVHPLIPRLRSGCTPLRMIGIFFLGGVRTGKCDNACRSARFIGKPGYRHQVAEQAGVPQLADVKKLHRQTMTEHIDCRPKARLKFGRAFLCTSMSLRGTLHSDEAISPKLYGNRLKVGLLRKKRSQ